MSRCHSRSKSTASHVTPAKPGGPERTVLLLCVLTGRTLALMTPTSAARAVFCSTRGRSQRDGRVIGPLLRATPGRARRVAIQARGIQGLDKVDLLVM
jgi:hypothetical protein